MSTAIVPHQKWPRFIAAVQTYKKIADEVASGRRRPGRGTSARKSAIGRAGTNVIDLEAWKNRRRHRKAECGTPGEHR